MAFGCSNVIWTTVGCQPLTNGWRTVGRATVGIATVGIPFVIRLQNYDIQQSLLIGEEVKFHACTSAVFKNWNLHFYFLVLRSWCLYFFRVYFKESRYMFSCFLQVFSIYSNCDVYTHDKNFFCYPYQAI